MALVLDHLGSRYGQLPSTVLRQGDTLDMYVMDVALAWEQYVREREDAKSKGLPNPAPKLSVEQMQTMLERVKK